MEGYHGGRKNGEKRKDRYLLEITRRLADRRRDGRRVRGVRGEDLRISISNLPHQKRHLKQILSAGVVLCTDLWQLTIRQRRHPGLDRVREALDERAEPQDRRVQRAEPFLVCRVPPLGELRPPRERNEAVLWRRGWAHGSEKAHGRRTLRGMMLCRCEHLTTPDNICEAISRTSTLSSFRALMMNSLSVVMKSSEKLVMLR